MINLPRHNHTEDTFELLSGYLDDALDLVERRRADTLLRDCSACASELEELRMLQQTLRALPVPMPKRSFTLDPATVKPRMRWFPIFRFASLVSAMLLVVILGLDTLGGAGSAQDTTAALQAPAPAAESQLRTAPQSTEGSAAASAPAAEAPVAEAPAIAGGLPPEDGAEDALSTAPEAAAAPSVETPEVAAMGDAVPEANEEAEAQTAKTPPDVTAAPAQADPDAARNSDAPVDETASVMAAEAAPESTVAPEAFSGAAGAAPLTNSDTSSPDTTSLQAPLTAPGPGSADQPLNLWLVAEIILAILVVVLAGATWWTARQRL